MGSLRETYLDWPHEVSIETYSKCNAHCSFCPYPTLDRVGTKLSDETLDRLIDELKDHPHPFIISPFKVNEPLLDKRLIPFCQKVNEQLPNAVLRIFTNGSALTDWNIAQVSHLKRVMHLWVSLNEHRPDEYKELMGLDFERTATNLDALHAAVAALAFTHDVVLSKVAADGLENPIQNEFRAYCAGRWPLFKVHVIKPDTWLKEVDLPEAEIPDAPCSRWFELSIMATGKVALCCMDGEGQYTIGDVHEQSLFEIYNGKAWRQNRLTMWSRKNVTPCATCSY